MRAVLTLFRVDDRGRHFVTQLHEVAPGEIKDTVEEHLKLAGEWAGDARTRYVAVFYGEYEPVLLHRERLLTDWDALGRLVAQGERDTEPPESEPSGEPPLSPAERGGNPR